MHHLVRHSLIALTCALAACSLELDLGDGVEKGGNDCDVIGCGVNTPRFATYMATPVRSTVNAPSESGFTNLGFRKGGDALSWEIAEGELVASDGAGTEYSGDAVEGGKFMFRYGSEEYELYVLDHILIEYWTRPGEFAHLYRMNWSHMATGRTGELCANPPLYEQAEWGGIGHYAFFVAGESWDVPSISVTETGGGASDVVNIACAGSGLAKANLYSYSSNIPPADLYATQPKEREMLIRLYAATYCYDEFTGPGDEPKRYTVPGQPLQIEDSRGWMSVDYAQSAAVEAVWSADGLVCLEEARRPDIVAGLGLDCAPPTCASLGLDTINADRWKSYGEFRSLIPL